MVALRHLLASVAVAAAGVGGAAVPAEAPDGGQAALACYPNP